MSQDIRSYFTVISSKAQSKPTTPAKTSKKRAKAIDSSDDDVVPETPVLRKQEKVAKKRKVNVINSDSEDEKAPKKKDRPKEKNVTNKEHLKPVSTLDIFGNEPVKQSKVPEKPVVADKPLEVEKKAAKGSKRSKKQLKTELGIHNDENFEKTLLELDEEFLLQNVDELDKSIDEALTKGKSTVSPEKSEKVKETPNKKKVTPNKKGSSSSEEVKTPKQKQPTQDYDGDPDQERYEKKRQSAILYQKYLNRSGPAHHGSKDIPKGKPDCLQNLCFIRTGVLDSLESEEFENLIKDHGGRVVHAVSKKVNYMVAGEEPGPAKLEKAKSYGIKIISEDELLDLIRTKSGIKPNASDVTEQEVGEELKKNHAKMDVSPKKSKSVAKVQHSKSEAVAVNGTVKLVDQAKIINVKPLLSRPTVTKLPNGQEDEHIPWTEKYKPTSVKAIIGQQGDKSNMKKLMFWLQNWYKNHSGKNRPKLVRPSPWATNDDGSYFKAALLSGPPGVGKTTTAHLVAKELGFDIVEFNASDTRNKRLLHEQVSQLLSTKSLAGFFIDGSTPTSKHVLLMDEVDGMAGNEDRGGIQELIGLIKNTNVPIVCMCNDRNHPKVRSLANYCLDLRFPRPRVEQIKGAMMSVCFKAGIKITPDALTEVINGAGMDVRQILTHLSMWSAEDKALSTETASKEAKSAKKDTPLGPWEVCRKVFSAEEHKNMSIGDRSRLFYHDYSLAPLFVQENYLKVMPHAPKKEHLERFAATANAISMGDMVDTKIRRSNNWSLLDVEAMCASVLPGYYVEGHMNGQIDFPGWLGKNSKKNKFSRLLSELQAHMRTSTSGSRSAVNLDYVTHLRNSIVTPLAKQGTEGINKALDVMHTYNLLREDLDNILELAQWPRQKDPMNLVDSKVKAAFTRAYNKDGTKLPYAVQVVPVKKRGATTVQNDGFEEEEDAFESENEDDGDVSKDAMIKAKKASSRRTKKEAEPSTSTNKRGKGNTKGGSKQPATKRSKK